MLGGFKNFVLRGNLVDLAVAVIIGTAFGAVVSSFTAWLMGKIPATEETFKGAKEGDLGFFLNALISFLVLAAVVYFFVVLPYTKVKERYFPSAPPGTPEDIKLLQEIRDLIAAQQGTVPPTDGPGLTK
jgi:large conductance mechanosensitive channel